MIQSCTSHLRSLVLSRSSSSSNKVVPSIQSTTRTSSYWRDCSMNQGHRGQSLSNSAIPHRTKSSTSRSLRFSKAMLQAKNTRKKRIHAPHKAHARAWAFTIHLHPSCIRRKLLRQSTSKIPSYKQALYLQMIMTTPTFPLLHREDSILTVMAAQAPLT